MEGVGEPSRGFGGGDSQAGRAGVEGLLLLGLRRVLRVFFSFSCLCFLCLLSPFEAVHASPPPLPEVDGSVFPFFSRRRRRRRNPVLDSPR